MILYGNIEIAGEGREVTYILSVGLDFDKGDKRFMSCLAASRNYGMIDETYEFEWDNDEYIYNTLYKEVIIPWVDEKKVINPDEFASTLKQEGIHLDDFPIIKKMFEKAEEFNFFQEVKETKNE
jgi:hypothetical protein